MRLSSTTCRRHHVTSTGGGNMALLLLLLAYHVVGIEGRRPWFVRCQDSSDCGPKMCCSVMAGRYMVPMCMPMKKRPGEECSGHLVNMTVQYPRAIVVNLTDVYMEGCPCTGILVCKDGSCQSNTIDSNNLVDQ